MLIYNKKDGHWLFLLTFVTFTPSASSTNIEPCSVYALPSRCATDLLLDRELIAQGLLETGIRTSPHSERAYDCIKIAVNFLTEDGSSTIHSSPDLFETIAIMDPPFGIPLPGKPSKQMRIANITNPICRDMLLRLGGPLNNCVDANARNHRELEQLLLGSLSSVPQDGSSDTLLLCRMFSAMGTGKNNTLLQHIESYLVAAEACVRDYEINEIEKAFED